MVWSLFKKKPSLIKQMTNTPIVREKPLYEQFGRIGGGIGPVEVSNIIRHADGGFPARLVDLCNEGRGKDGHFQSICSTREGAVGLCEMRFLVPLEAKGQTKETD